jgi:hypothetical protein
VGSGCSPANRPGETGESQALHPLAVEDDARRRRVGNLLSFPELKALRVQVFAMA